jgi:hypothetical protein
VTDQVKITKVEATAIALRYLSHCQPSSFIRLSGKFSNPDVRLPNVNRIFSETLSQLHQKIIINQKLNRSALQALYIYESS